MSILTRWWTICGLALALAACGGGGSGGISGGGGSSGTGISFVTGNVTSVMIAQDGVDGIDVRIAGTNFATTTDAAGAFSVSGDFGGDLLLNFRRNVDGLDADLPIQVPTGGTLNLQNVSLDPSSGSATPDEQRVEFEGVVVAIDCAIGLFRVASTFDTSVDFRVSLEGAVLRDEGGNPIPCSQFLVGSEAEVVGTLAPDGTVIDAIVEIENDDGESEGGESGDGESDASPSTDSADGASDEESEDGESGDGESDDFPNEDSADGASQEESEGGESGDGESDDSPSADSADDASADESEDGESGDPESDDSPSADSADDASDDGDDGDEPSEGDEDPNDPDDSEDPEDSEDPNDPNEPTSEDP